MNDLNRHLTLYAARKLFASVLCIILTIVIVSLALLVLAGCAAQSPGNTSAHERVSVLDRSSARQDEYCATADPGRRAILLALIRTQYPLYPESGLCTDAQQATLGALAGQIDALPRVDTQQAVEDQRRAQQRLENTSNSTSTGVSDESKANAAGVSAANED